MLRQAGQPERGGGAEGPWPGNVLYVYYPIGGKFDTRSPPASAHLVTDLVSTTHPSGFILTLIWVSGPSAPPSSPPRPPSPHPGPPSIHLPLPSKIVARAHTHMLYVRMLSCDLSWFDALFFFKLINLCGKKIAKEKNKIWQPSKLI